MKNYKLLTNLEEINSSELRKISGGKICIFCVRGLLSRKHKATFNWGCCGKAKA